jgi:hypothetical protein
MLSSINVEICNSEMYCEGKCCYVFGLCSNIDTGPDLCWAGLLAKLAAWALSLMYMDPKFGMGPKAGGRWDQRGYNRDRLRGPRGVESATQPAGYVLGRVLQFF